MSLNVTNRAVNKNILVRPKEPFGLDLRIIGGGYVQNKQMDKATGAHFNQPSHDLANMKISVLEQVKINSDLYRKEREEFFIRKFDTLNEGMNRKI